MKLERPNIVFVKQTLTGGGGLEKWADRLIHAFAKKSAHLTILTADRKTGFNDPSISKVTLPKRHFDKHCRTYLRHHRAEIAFGLDRFSAQTHHRAGNGVHPAYLERRRLTDPKWKWKTLKYNPMHRSILKTEREGFEHAGLKKIFANSHMVAKEIERFYDVAPDAIEVIHNGVEWNEMNHDFDQWEEQKIELAKQLDLDPTDYHLLFIGNGYKRKGLDLLLRALHRLNRKDIHLSVIGKEKKIKEYIALAKKLGLENSVSFYGPQKNTAPFYQLADALAIPSHYDPFANVTIEALAMGLYVISSPHNGGSEILTPETGTIIPSLLEIGALSASLKTALQHPKTQKSAKKIRDSVKHLDFENVLETYVSATLC